MDTWKDGFYGERECVQAIINTKTGGRSALLAFVLDLVIHGVLRVPYEDPRHDIGDLMVGLDYVYCIMFKEDTKHPYLPLLYVKSPPFRLIYHRP